MKPILTALLLITACVQAEAQTGYENWGRPYIAGNAGISLVDNISINGEPGSTFSDIDLLIEDGLVITGAVGQYYGPGRVELEFVYRSHDIERIDLPFFHDLDVSGSFDYQGVMVNFLYDFDKYRRIGRISGYVGGGVGFANINVNAVSSGADRIDDSDMVLAYQFLAGLQNKVSTGVTVTGGYRAFMSSDPRLGGFKIDVDVSHSLELGVRLDF